MNNIKSVVCALLTLATGAAAVILESEVVGIKYFRGSAAAKEKLLAQGFVVTDETYRQICSFYVHREPAFVTTDSVFYAYYINVERALRELETKHAEGLPPLLSAYKADLREFVDADVGYRKSIRTLVKRGRLDGEWLDAAEDLYLYLSVAEALATGTPAEKALDEPPERFKRELELVYGAEGVAESPLRGIALDYGRFAPYGFYAEDGKLANYYRAATWMRDVVFRCEDENESRQVILFRELTVFDYDLPVQLYVLNSTYAGFLGPSDDESLDGITTSFAINNYRFDARETKAQSRERWAEAWADLKELAPPEVPTVPTAEGVASPGEYRGFRLMPRPTLYDNAIFRALTPYLKERPLASGEELMAALGSAAASEIVSRREAEEVEGYAELMEDAVAAAGEAQERYASALGKMQLEVFRTLLDPPRDKTLPAYYLHPNWRYKDLNTCLAGWAYHRYIWDAHAKRNLHYMGLIDNPPGVVEPNLAFFEALLRLNVYTDAQFKSCGVHDTDFNGVTALLVEIIPILRRQLAGEPLTPAQAEFLKDYGPRLGNACGFKGNSWLDDNALPDTPFCVPVSTDLLTGTERVVGQARPRAIYVICDLDGEKHLTVGGVMSYRDFVGPSEGAGSMTLENWRVASVVGFVPAPAWHEKFYARASEEELLEALRRGELREQMFTNPSVAMSDILKEKISRRDEFQDFTMRGDRVDGRMGAVTLLAMVTPEEEVVELLFPMLEKPDYEYPPQSIYQWPEAAALAGHLSDEKVDTVMGWVESGEHPYGQLLLILVSTAPGEHAEDVLIDYLDSHQQEAGESDVPLNIITKFFGGGFMGDSLWDAALYGIMQRPGLRASELLLGRIKKYKGSAQEAVVWSLAERWRDSYKDMESGELLTPDYTEEEWAFVEELKEAIGEEEYEKYGLGVKSRMRVK